MRLKRWIQIVVLCVLTTGCIPSACIVVGDVEWPATARGDYFLWGFYGVTTAFVVPPALYVWGGTLTNPLDPSWSPNGIVRVLMIVNRPKRNPAVEGLGIRSGNFQRAFNLRVTNGKVTGRRRLPELSFAPGDSVLVRVIAAGFPIPAGTVWDFDGHFTPNGQDPKEALTFDMGKFKSIPLQQMDSR